MTPGIGPMMDPRRSPERDISLRERTLLFIAHGFGVGALLPAPGTWGSLLGIWAFAALAWPGDYLLYVLGTVLCILISVPICTAAEGILKRKDPGSVVLDELTAMPLCYLGWVTDTWLEIGRCSLDDLFASASGWLLLGVGFVTFRFFDILKPWPIRTVQALPGGWGVVLDDLLAGLATAAVVLILSRAI